MDQINKKELDQKINDVVDMVNPVILVNSQYLKDFKDKLKGQAIKDLSRFLVSDIEVGVSTYRGIQVIGYENIPLDSFYVVEYNKVNVDVLSKF